MPLPPPLASDSTEKAPLVLMARRGPCPFFQVQGDEKQVGFGRVYAAVYPSGYVEDDGGLRVHRCCVIMVESQLD